MLSWLSGAKLYALLGLGALLLALSGAIAYLWQVHKLDASELARQRGINAGLTKAIQQEEADKAELSRRIGALDEALKHELDLQAKLAKDKQAISEKLDALKKTLPQPDQERLDRPLPDGIIDLLRDGPGNRNQDRNPEDTGKPAHTLHEIGVSG